MWSWCWPSAAENELGEQKGTTDSVPTVASSSSSLSLMREPSANVTLAAESPVDHQDAAPQPLPGPYVTSEADSEQILTEMEVLHLQREQRPESDETESALHKAIAAGAVAASAPKAASPPSPRAAMRQREEERQKQRAAELQKQKQLLEQLEENRQSKNEALVAKSSRRERKERAKEKAEKAQREARQTQHIHSMLDEMRGLGEVEFRTRVEPLFKAMDKDGSGSIDVDELRKVMQALKQPMTDEELAAMITEADTNGDHLMGLDEFTTVLRKQVTEGSGAWTKAIEGRSFMHVGSWLSFPSPNASTSPASIATSQRPSRPTSPFSLLSAATSPRASPATSHRRVQYGRKGGGGGGGPTSTHTSTSPGDRTSDSSARVSSPRSPLAVQRPVVSAKGSSRRRAAGGAAAGAGHDSAVGPPMSSEEAMLRAKLRNAFAMFDADSSGTISSTEMAKVVKLCGMRKTPAELSVLMAEADPDNSGEIDFEEFVAVLRAQVKAGGGGLASAVSGASTHFGWLNPFTWFAPDEQKPRQDEPEPWLSPIDVYGGGTWTFPIRLTESEGYGPGKERGLPQGIVAV